MEEGSSAYEEKRRNIRSRIASRKKTFDFGTASVDEDLMQSPLRKVPVYDLVQLGSKVIMGAGVGLLAGVAAIATVASVAEIVVAGVVTKIAGVVGGTAALSWGLRDFKSKRQREFADEP